MRLPMLLMAVLTLPCHADSPLIFAQRFGPLGGWRDAHPPASSAMLIPVHHMRVQDLCDALVRNPNMLPQGLTRLEPLDDHGALLAEGSERAVGQLREVVMLLDSPQARIAVEVGLLVTPGAGERRFRPEWLSAPDQAAPETGTAIPPRRFEALVRGYRERGGEVVLSRALPQVLVANGEVKTVWLDADFAGLCDPSALAGGVVLSPRLVPDGNVLVAVALVAAIADPAGGVRFIQQSQVQATVADGDSLVYGGHFLGEGEEHRQEVVIVVIPRVVFGSRW